MSFTSNYNSYAQSSLARRVNKILSDEPTLNTETSKSPRTFSRRVMTTQLSPSTDGGMFKSQENFKSYNTLTHPPIPEFQSAAPVSKKPPKKKSSTTKTTAKRSGSLTTKKPVSNSSYIDNYAYHIPWLQQRHIMNLKIHDLEDELGRQDKKMKQLRKKHLGEKDKIKKMNREVTKAQKKDDLIRELDDRLRNMQEAQEDLFRELEDQQKTSRDALFNLQKIESEAQEEIHRAKQHYNDLLEQKLDEERKISQENVLMVQKEKVELESRLKQLETSQDFENTNRTIATSNEIVQLNSQLNAKEIECDKLKNAFKDQESYIETMKKDYEKKIGILNDALDKMEDQLATTRDNEDILVEREEAGRKSFKKKVENLNNELEQRDKLLREKDITYKEQLDHINNKVLDLTGDLKRMAGYEEAYNDLEHEYALKENELKLLKKYYEEKIESEREYQQEQKKEWSRIYNELLVEIRALKTEIDSLGIENRRLLSASQSKNMFGESLLKS